MRPDREHRLGLGGAVDGFVGGVSFVLFTPAVWPWAAVPAVILLMLVCGGGALGIWGAEAALRDWLGDRQARGAWAGVGYWTLLILLTPLALLLAAVLGLTLAQPLSGFALERVSQAQQRRLTGSAGPSHPFLASLWLNLRTVGFALAVGGAALTALFVIGIAFPPAAVVTVPLKFLVCSWVLAWDFLDYPLGLRGLGVAARLRWVSRHFGAFTLFGALWSACCVVPGAVLLLLPMGVAGATRMVLRDDPRALG